MQGCRSCGRRHRCNDKDRSMGMACKDYEARKDQIEKTSAQSLQAETANKDPKKGMRLARKRGAKAAEAKADHRRERDRSRRRDWASVRECNRRGDIDLLPDGGTVLEGGEGDARSGNDYDR